MSSVSKKEQSEKVRKGKENVLSVGRGEANLTPLVSNINIGLELQAYCVLVL